MERYSNNVTDRKDSLNQNIEQKRCCILIIDYVKYVYYNVLFNGFYLNISIWIYVNRN